MQITSKDAPNIVKPATANSTATQSARERAIDALLKPAVETRQANTQNAQEHPVLDPTRVGLEEFTAVQRSISKDAPQQGQSDKIETAAEAASPEATKVESEEAAPNPLSSQYAQLARKEKAIRAQARQLESERAAIQAQQAEIKAKEQRYQELSLQERLKREPMAVLNELGVTYDQLTEAAINAPKPLDPLVAEQQAKIKSLEEKLDKLSKGIDDQRTDSYKQAVNQIKMETKHLVNSDEQFETIKATNSYDDVVDLIEQTYKQDGVLLSVEEAAKAVEDYLVEEAVKIARLKKIQGRLTPQQAKQVSVAPVETGNNKQGQMKTLTNNIASTRQLTPKERAILAFKGELKKS